MHDRKIDRQDSMPTQPQELCTQYLNNNVVAIEISRKLRRKP